MCSKKKIAVTTGDPLGIGPEIAVRALASEAVRDVCEVRLVGDRLVLAKAAKLRGIESFEERFGQYIEDVPLLSDKEASRALVQDDAAWHKYAGTVQAFAGEAAVRWITRAHELCSSGECKAVATAPINKESLRAAQVPYIGHTEIFAGLTDTADPLTMFETCGLRVFFLSRHVSLREACDMVTCERLTRYIERCTDALRTINIDVNNGSTPPLAVAGLNPHSGEHGLFGDDEVRIIEPSVQAMRERGFNVVGPVSADSVFSQAYHGKYSAVLSLYHDQGHIATKTLDFERTISVTHGLPYLRTSVDHGTAFDVAWKGTASAVSMVEAILSAARNVQ